MRFPGSSAIHGRVEKRRKCVNQGRAKRVLPGDQISREHAPRALSIANAARTGKCVYSDAELGAFVHDLFRQGFRQQNAAGLAVRAVTVAVRHIRPILKKDQAAPAIEENVKAALESHAEMPRQVAVSRSTFENLCTVFRARHCLCARERSVRHAAWNFFADHFESGPRVKSRPENAERFPQSVQLGLPCGTGRDDYFWHALTDGLTAR